MLQDDKNINKAQLNHNNRRNNDNDAGKIGEKRNDIHKTE